MYEFGSVYDCGCNDDLWFRSVADAFECMAEDYSEDALDWFLVEPPQEHCQGDWITPARIPGRETGDPQWGRLQLKMDGEWKEHNMAVPSAVIIDYNKLTLIKHPYRDAGIEKQ